MRLKNVIKNSFFNIISQIVLIIVGFFSQRVLNLKIGEELVGMNSVISNVCRRNQKTLMRKYILRNADDDEFSTK